MTSLRKKFAMAVLVIASSITMMACSDPQTAKNTLDSAGYTDISTQGHSWTGCGKDDTYATKFIAKNPRGKYVSGVVCNGWMKGGTIRF